MSNYEYQNFSIIKAHGQDTKKFLQGLATADLNILSDDNSVLLTAFANLKGRIISLCFVKYVSEDTLLLSVETSVKDDLLSWFKKYGMFSKVSFEISEVKSLFYTEGGFLNHDILDKSTLENNIDYNQVQKSNIINNLATINATNHEKLLPAELKLDDMENVISYSKGCYMGQEVIARMHYKAKLKKELAVVKSDADIQSGDLKDENAKPLGYVVNSVFIDGECYVLVIFHKQQDANQITLESGDVITKC